MLLYHIKIQLAGSRDNEVRKDDVTAAEVVVLKRIHGLDTILEIKHTGEVNRTDETERQRLQELYGRALRGIEAIKTLDALLGVEGVPLPASVTGVPKNPKAKQKADPKPEPEVGPVPADDFT